MQGNINNFSKPNQWLGVFCGSYSGNDEDIHSLASALGTAMAKRGIGLVYGGGGIGIMGTIADSVLDEKGYVIGVVPENLMETEMAHQSLSELIVVESMHDRKRTMYKYSDAFCALPGGLGTLEEVFEAATWTKLDLHRKYKPVLLFDQKEFWDGLEKVLNEITSAGFIKPQDRAILNRVKTVEQVLSIFDEN